MRNIINTVDLADIHIAEFRYLFRKDSSKNLFDVQFKTFDLSEEFNEKSYLDRISSELNCEIQIACIEKNRYWIVGKLLGNEKTA